jgi:hypothetical protein
MLNVSALGYDGVDLVQTKVGRHPNASLVRQVVDAAEEKILQGVDPIEMARKAARFIGDGSAAKEVISQLTRTDAALATELATEPTPNPNCADIGVNGALVDGKCAAWVVNGGHCSKDWAISDCAESCGICTVCTPGEFDEWSTCTSTCGGGGQYRTQDPGDCGDDSKIVEHQQCNTQSCDAGECSLSASPNLVITEDNAVVEGVSITASGKEAAIFVLNAANVTLRNIKIVHEGSDRVKGQNDTLGEYMDESGAGIFFKNSPNIRIENVHVSLVRPSPNPHAADGECATEYCGPFPKSMQYAYNIYGESSASPTLLNVYVTGGSTGFWCKECPYGRVSHFKAENLHGPYPRGQCFQVVSCEGFVLEDFTCIQDNQKAFPEDDVSLWGSPYAIARRGLIQGGNAPNGVGVIMEMSDNVVVEDIDVTLVGGTCFSAYGAHNVSFLRTRAKDNHADGGCLAGKGYCKDMNGDWPNSDFYADDVAVPDKTCCGEEALERCDTKGGVWYAGDYTDDQAGGKHTGYLASDVSVKQGVFYGMTAIEAEEEYSNEGTCVDINMDYWANSAATRQEAYILKDFKEEDFTLREPFEPTFCFL